MRSTGIVRKVDELGRIVIPRELRRTLDINEKDPLEIFVEEEKIILKKYEADMACAMTGEVSPENQVYPGNIILSPKGAKMLFDQLSEKVK